MPSTRPEDEANHPSQLALKHEREIGKLNEGLESVESRLGGVEKKLDSGLDRLFLLVDGLKDRMAPKPNSPLYLGVAGLMLAGIPMIAALVYFTVTSTVSPLRESIVKLEQAVQVSKDHEWDNFELEVRDDQCLIDAGLKANETDTIMKSDQKAKKKKKAKEG